MGSLKAAAGNAIRIRGMEISEGPSDYHGEVDKTFYSVPHRLIGRTVQVRLTHRVVEIFHDHLRFRDRHPQVRPRPGEHHRAGKADTAARQHPRRQLLPVKERKKEC